MKKIITIDFDETLAVSETGAWHSSNLIPIQRIIDYVKKEHQQGAEFHIVSFRNQDNKKEMIQFCSYHSIPIKSFTCTEGQNKIPYIKKLNSKLHIDDSVEVCTLCIMAGIEVLLVDWGQDESNTTAKFLPKI
jgi:uncharacterized HAD superfamily protein